MKNKKQFDNRADDFSYARQTVIAYFLALATEFAAFFTGMHAGKLICGSGNHFASPYAKLSIILGLVGIFVVISGVINSFLNAKSLRAIGLFVLVLCLIIALASQLVEVSICF